jgi:hypothetical protein
MIAVRVAFFSVWTLAMLDLRLSPAIFSLLDVARFAAKSSAIVKMGARTDRARSFDSGSLRSG